MTNRSMKVIMHMSWTRRRNCNKANRSAWCRIQCILKRLSRMKMLCNNHLFLFIIIEICRSSKTRRNLCIVGVGLKDIINLSKKWPGKQPNLRNLMISKSRPTQTKMISLISQFIEVQSNKESWSITQTQTPTNVQIEIDK